MFGSIIALSRWGQATFSEYKDDERSLSLFRKIDQLFVDKQDGDTYLPTSGWQAFHFSSCRKRGPPCTANYNKIQSELRPCIWGPCAVFRQNKTRWKISCQPLFLSCLLNRIFIFYIDCFVLVAAYLRYSEVEIRRNIELDPLSPVE